MATQNTDFVQEAPANEIVRDVSPRSETVPAVLVLKGEIEPLLATGVETGLGDWFGRMGIGESDPPTVPEAREPLESRNGAIPGRPFGSKVAPMMLLPDAESSSCIP